MRAVTIYNLTHPLAEPVRAGWCDTFLCRLRGLMFRKALAFEDSIVLVQDKDNRLDAGIHMMFVSFDLAVVWINNAGEVVDVHLAKSWELAYVPRAAARYVLEMPADHLQDFQIGDRVRFDGI